MKIYPYALVISPGRRKTHSYIPPAYYDHLVWTDLFVCGVQLWSIDHMKCYIRLFVQTSVCACLYRSLGSWLCRFDICMKRKETKKLKTLKR